MTTQEQIKIYAAYLPYGLQAKLNNKGIFNLDREYPDPAFSRLGTINSWQVYDGNLSGSIWLSERMSVDFESIDEIDIALWDLSYLTKEIEHEGRKFIPIVQLAKLGTREEDCYITNGNLGTCYVDAKFQKKGFFFYHPSGFFIWQVGKNAEPLTVWNQMELFEKLKEWHFNIFGIPAGDFIDKSTLKIERND